MEGKKGADIDPTRAKEVQDILEKMVTHLLVKKPEDPVNIIS